MDLNNVMYAMDDKSCILVCKLKYLFFSSTLTTSVMCLHFTMEEEDILEHTNGRCRLCTLQSSCRLMCNIYTHLITLLNILMPTY